MSEADIKSTLEESKIVAGASFQKLEENIRIYMNPKNGRKAPVSSHAK